MTRLPAADRHRQPENNSPAQGWVLAARGITKRYGNVQANQDVSLELRSGEIHAVLGENGAGKSTIMKIVYGMELPDEGTVAIDGRALDLRSPRDAIRAGIGMVHQHFMLVPTLTVLENLILGTEFTGRFALRKRNIAPKLSALAKRYRIDVDLGCRVSRLSVGEQQRVEILKALVRGARAIILDEPTAVLTPAEIAGLATTLRELASEGHGVFIVTHKLAEVMGISDRVSVMRQGRMIGTWWTRDTNANELVSHMVGHSLPPARPRSESHPGRPILELRDVRTSGIRGRLGLRSLSLRIAEGEIVGVAGVDGNGQSELAEAITGLRHVDSGEVLLDGVPMTNKATAEVLAAGVAHVPEDRHRDGVVLDFSVAENAILVRHGDSALRRHGGIDRGAVERFTSRLIGDYAIRCSGPEAIMRGLSGGNQQKLVLARELARSPKLLIAMQPTRGLDVGAIDYVHSRLIEQRKAGMAILLVSTELDEILALSDRIAVLRDGRIAGEMDRHHASIEAIGNLMLGSSEMAS
jgi:simple sugar transport system ATP-binding protein